MKTINVLVRDKIASAVGDIVYVCGNSDYVVSFDFDAEWDAYSVKTARFVHNGTYTDVVFTGNQCAMPVIHKAYGIYVGVYAGDLRTTTPAHIPSAASILSAEGTPAAPPDDVYAQITALCNEAVAEAKSVRDDADAGKFNGAPGKTPVPGADYFTEADKQAIAAEAAQEVGFPQPTSEDNGMYLGCKNGAAKWLPVEASGGESAFRKMIDITTAEDVAKIEINEDMNGNKLSMSRFIFNVEVPAASGSAKAFFGSGVYRWLGADTAGSHSYGSKSLQLGTSKVNWWGEFVMNVEKDGARAILYMRASKTPYPDNTISSDGGTYALFDVRKYPYSSGAGNYYLHESFDRIFYRTDSSTVMIPAGTRIKVWGVDA